MYKKITEFIALITELKSIYPKAHTWAIVLGVLSGDYTD